MYGAWSKEHGAKCNKILAPSPLRPAPSNIYTCFLFHICRKIKAIINTAGIKATNLSVCSPPVSCADAHITASLDPATADFNASKDCPAGTALSVWESKIAPRTGCAIAPPRKPIPPIIARPKAPLCGIFSDTKPSIDGQKNATPSANTPAEAKTMAPLV